MGRWRVGWLDRWMDGPANPPKQALLFPISQANDMTFLPEKNKMSTECRTPTWWRGGFVILPQT